MIAIRLCVLSVLLVAIPTWTWAQDVVVQDFLTCSDIINDSVRLACYDTVSNTHTQEPVELVESGASPLGPDDDELNMVVDPKEAPGEVAEVAPVEAPEEAPTETPAVAAIVVPIEAAKEAPIEAPTEVLTEAAEPAAASKEEANVVPLTDDVGLNAFERDEADAPQAIGATVTRCREDSRGKYNFYFDNGQVWKQVDDRRYRFKECDFTVTITKDAFGYRMVPDGETRKIRISRIR